MTYLLLLIIAVACYVIYNLLMKVEKYEKIILEQTSLIDDIFMTILNMNEKIKEIDQRGTFESDDEVGFFFNELKQMQSTLNQYIENDVSKKESSS
jgi:hypothetical protein